MKHTKAPWLLKFASDASGDIGIAAGGGLIAMGEGA